MVLFCICRFKRMSAEICQDAVQGNFGRHHLQIVAQTLIQSLNMPFAEAENSKKQKAKSKKHRKPVLVLH